MLNARHVLQAARADFVRYNEKSAVWAGGDEPPRAETTFKPIHVAYATAPKDIIRSALRDGVLFVDHADDPPNRRLVYKPELLEAALALANKELQ